MQYLTDLLQYLKAGGFVMPPLVVGTVILWYALGYRYAVLNRGNRRSVRVLVERYREGYDRRPRGIVDAAVVRGLEIARTTRRDLRRFLDDAFTGYERDVGRYETLARSIVVAAPLLGLLGTVAGMIETFNALGDQVLFSQTGGIAGGVSQALVSTQMGLAVGIPGRVVGQMLERRQRGVERELAQIKDILCTEG